MDNKIAGKNRIFLTILAILMIVVISIVNHNTSNKNSKDVGVAVNRNYVAGAIFEEAVPLAGTVAQNSVGYMEADTLSNKEFAVDVFNKVNNVRKENGLKTLDWSENLYKAGLVRVVEIISKWSHTRPNGTDWYTVDANLMYGENLGKGFTSAEEVVDAWMNSPSHKENILYGFNTMAISVYQASDGTYYIAQEFGY